LELEKYRKSNNKKEENTSRRSLTKSNSENNTILNNTNQCMIINQKIKSLSVIRLTRIKFCSNFLVSSLLSTLLENFIEFRVVDG